MIKPLTIWVCISERSTTEHDRVVAEHAKRHNVFSDLLKEGNPHKKIKQNKVDSITREKKILLFLTIHPVLSRLEVESSAIRLNF